MESVLSQILNKNTGIEIVKNLNNRDLLNLELVSKKFKFVVDEFYYLQTSFLPFETNSKIDSIINNASSTKENLNKYKKMFYKTYLDSFVLFNVSENKFDALIEVNESTNQDKTKTNSKKKESSYMSQETPNLDKLIFSRYIFSENSDHNRNSIKDIVTKENRILILYNSGEIKTFTKKCNGKHFEFEFKISKETMIINQFIFVEEHEAFVISDKFNRIYYMTYEPTFESNNNMIIHEIHEINFEVKSLFNLKTIVLITDFNDKLYFFDLSDYIAYKSNGSSYKEKEENTQSEESKEKTINEEEGKRKEIANYCLFNTNIQVSKISCSTSKMTILDKNSNLFLVYETELENAKSLTLILKPVQNFKSNNIVDIACGEQHWLVLEREDIKSIENWDCNEVMEWFKSLELDEFLNIIKYEKITGKDILKEDQTFYEKVLGMPNDIYQKVRYEINNVKNPFAKSMKLWGCGSHKQGQLGMFQNNNCKDNFYKIPITIPLPPLKNEYDYFSKVFCGKSFSILLSQFGEVFITGNYENKFIPLVAKVEKSSNDGGKGKKQKNNVKSEPKKDKNIPTHRWINLTNEICFNSQLFFKIKIIKLLEKDIYFFGYKSNNVPFTLQQAKPKSKHLGTGSKKFPAADKILGKIIALKMEKNCFVIYEDPLLKKLEQNLEEYLESEVPYHKIIQIKYHNEIVWDRKKRFYKYENENFE